MKHELEKTYSPASFEERIYAEWCEKKYFTNIVDNYCFNMPYCNASYGEASWSLRSN